MTRHPAIRRRAALAILTMLLLLVATPALAESSRVVMVEEHWELVLSKPDPDRSAPQATMLMSPAGDIDGVHFLVTLNHLTTPEYAAGGIQVQAWDGDQLVDEQSAEAGTALSYEGEVVRWVQRLKIEDGTMHFQIRDGSSESWGEFGSDLSVSASTTQTGLNSYRPAISLQESQVGYAENRVSSLVLTKLVWETEDGQVHEQSAPIPIDMSLE